jgi:hypothetical protein
VVSVAAVKHEWLWRAAFLAGDNHRHRLCQEVSWETLPP